MRVSLDKLSRSIQDICDWMGTGESESVTSRLFTKYHWLKGDHMPGSGLVPIPSYGDKRIAVVLRKWLSLNRTERLVASAGITWPEVNALLTFSERMASFAVRTRNAEHVFWGLLANGVDNWEWDYRENLLVLPLLNDALVRIGSLPYDVFEKAANELPEKSAAGLRGFQSLDDEGKQIGVMGYIADQGTEGFVYRRTW